MAKKQREPIRVKALINIRGLEYDLDQMTQEQRNFVGAVLKAKYLNALFPGRVQFFVLDLPPVEEIFPKAEESF